VGRLLPSVVRSTRAGITGSLLAGPLLLAGCAGKLSTLDPAGPAAHDTATLFWIMALVATGFTFGVGGLFLLAISRRRKSVGTVNEGFWTRTLGIGLPLAVLALLLGATLWLGERQFVRDPALPVVRATASQWGWRFEPVGADGVASPATPRLEMLAGQPVIVELVSDDVIHSFWVPRLAGKMDVVPGKVNRHLLEADRPGIYQGLCAEYCGIGHDHMRFEVAVRSTGDGQ